MRGRGEGEAVERRWRGAACFERAKEVGSYVVEWRRPPPGVCGVRKPEPTAPPDRSRAAALLPPPASCPGVERPCGVPPPSLPESPPSLAPLPSRRRLWG